jgi:mRNA-degrading endonuclease RelE of RelBE toxin-antitoxin system
MASRRAFRYVVTRSAAKQLRQCPRRAAILDLLEDLCRDPFRSDNNVKPLSGIQGGYRRRFGDWRVSYLVDRRSRMIEVFEVAPRGGAYR